MLKNIKTINILILAICAAGLFVSLLLLQDHHLSSIERSSGEKYNAMSTISQIACGEDSRVFNCEKVKSSGFADVKGFPVAALGIIFYLFAAGAILFGKKLKGGDEDISAKVTFSAFLISAIISIVFFLISAFKIHAYCSLCITHYLIVLSGLGLSVVILRLKKINPLSIFTSALKIDTAKIRPALPIAAQFAGIALVAAAAGIGINEFYKNAGKSHSAYVTHKKAVETAEAIKKLPQVKFSSEEITVLGKPDAPVTITIVTDFLCPACQKSGWFMNDYLLTRGDKIRVVYYNFPLDKSCNRAMKNDLHPGACLIAQGTICAAEEKRFDTYYKMAYSSGRPGMNAADVENLAAASGIDRKKFSACMASGKPKKIIQQQIDEAISLGINSTPRLFVNGRPYKHKLSDEVLDILVEDELKAAGKK